MGNAGSKFEKPQFSAKLNKIKGGKIKKTRRIELNALARDVALQFSENSVTPSLLTAMFRLAEFFGLIFISLCIYFAYINPAPGLLLYYLLASLVGATLTIAFTQGLDGYKIDTMRSLGNQLAKPLLAFAFALLAMLVVAFFTKISAEFSRLWYAAWASGGMVFLIGARILQYRYIQQLVRDRRIERRAVIVGGGEPAAELIRSIELQGNNDIRICGIFDDRDASRSPEIVAGYPKLGSVAELVEFSRIAHLDMLIVTLPLSAEARVLQLLQQLWVLPLDIRLSAHNNKLRFRPRTYSYEGPLPFLDVLERPIADWDGVTKRVFDIFFATLALIGLSPLMAFTALAIRMESKGPILFRQKRYGFNNEVIDVLKFRSMYHEMTDHDAKKVVTKDDPRVTRVGRIIRKYSIDELPQLVNVLKGELSLVGPRPHAVNAHTKSRLWDDVIDGYFARHKVKPGVTGWAQINGWRGEVDNDEKIRQRVDHDLYYIENWSIGFDMKIMLLTPFKLLDTENAY